MTFTKLKSLFCLSILCLLIPASVAGFPFAQSTENSGSSLAPMLEEVNPAVVNIATWSEQKSFRNPLYNDPFFRHFFNIPQQRKQTPKRQQRSAGSGVIVDADNGIVMTNYHVIKDADEVQVSLADGRSFIAEVVGTDPDLDIAILRIEGDDLSEVSLSDSDDLLVGDFVVAIGNPFGLGQTVTTGIVSALGRSGLGMEGYENFIQTDASINPGNSGGALVNLKGELVGINTAIISPAGGNVGIGFAIPVNMARNSMERILENGEVKRGLIGVGIQDIDAQLRKAFELENGQQGVLLTVINPDSPAEKAGLETGDIIVQIDGKNIANGAQLRSEISMRRIGDELRVTVLRDGREKSFDVAVGEPQRITDIDENIHRLLQGAQFESLDNNEGVKITAIQRNSPAAYSGLRRGDIIIGANRLRVTDIKSFEQALSRSHRQILLRVQRGGATLFIVVR